MDIYIYIILFLMGIFFGSFFTLAVYRIPLHEDILYKQSYCPKCKHKLGILDLIPIISYITLRGRCRYCKQKVRVRYLLLEILSGIVFVLVGYSMNIGLYQINSIKVIDITFILLYFASLFIIAGIDKENIKVENSLILYGVILSLLYIIYSCILKNNSVYVYVIYLCFMLFFILINTIILRKKLNYSYTIEVLTLCTYMAIFTKAEVLSLSILLSLILIGIVQLYKKIISKKEYKLRIKVPIAYYICISNIILILLDNYFMQYVI